MEKLGKIVGQRIEKLRVSRNLSREKVAQGVAIDPVTLYRIERAKQGITLDVIESLSRYFAVEPAMFFTDKVVYVTPTVDDALDLITAHIRSTQTSSRPQSESSFQEGEIGRIEKIADAMLNNHDLIDRAEAALGLINQNKTRRKEKA